MMSSAARDAARAVCITRDAALKRALRRTLNATGSQVEFHDSWEGGDDFGSARILFLDRDSRKSAPMPVLMQVLEHDGKVIILGESLEDDEVVTLLRTYGLDHVISDANTPDEVELVVTSVKLLSGDLFGVEKYLSWGVVVKEVEVATYEEKRAALTTVSEYARQVGARRTTRARVESVVDELLMNAMYDAPAIRGGVNPLGRIAKSIGERPAAAEHPAILRYACDGRYFAVSVQDAYGELQKEAILDHLMRARAEKGRPKGPAESPGGAGLGLYFILSSVTRFIANIDPGTRTEVICLFDLQSGGKNAEHCARSLHIFTSADGNGSGNGASGS